MSDKPELFFDVLILGGGPAGLSAAVYAARGNLKAAVLDTNVMGGKPAEYLNIENYPGFPSINACELSEKFEEHADKFGVEKFPSVEIMNVNLTDETKTVETTEHIFKAKSVVIATGTKPKPLNIPGEREFKCRGVSYCAVCDGMFYKDKVLAVVGGGNSAVEEAVYLTRFASKVYLVHRRNEFRADKIVVERAKANGKIEFVLNSVPTEIKGEQTVNSLVIKNVNNGNISELAVSGVFSYIGELPNVELFSDRLKLTKEGYIETDSAMQTSIPGVYAAGDVRNTPLRQVVTAVSDGAIAACEAVKYVEKANFAKTV